MVPPAEGEHFKVSKLRVWYEVPKIASDGDALQAWALLHCYFRLALRVEGKCRPVIV